jgi:hypothetical protein
VFKRGALFIPVIGGFWVVQNVDLFLLSRYVSDAEIGLYRVAGRVAAIGSYLSSAFLMAWNPLRLTATFQAVEEERGPAAIRGEIVAYFLFAGLWLVLGLAVAADAVVRIAPESYAGAASLIPLLAAGAVAHGLLVVLYRSSKFPRRRRRYPAIVVAGAVLFVPLSVWLIKSFGATGAAVSAVIIFMLGALLLCVLSQTGPTPIDFQYRRMALALFSAVACLGVALAVKQAGEPWRYVADAGAVIAYPILLVVTGALPRPHLGMVRLISRAVIPVSSRRSKSWRPSFEALDVEETRMLELAVRHQHSPPQLAEQFGAEEPEIHRRLVHLVRVVASLEVPDGDRQSADHRIGVYLFSSASPDERDALARALYAQEITTAGEIDTLERIVETLRELPPGAWEDRWFPPER